MNMEDSLQSAKSHKQDWIIWLVWQILGGAALLLKIWSFHLMLVRQILEVLRWSGANSELPLEVSGK
jgi:hypothetical protein